MGVIVRPKVAIAVWGLILLAVAFSIGLTIDTRGNQGELEAEVQPVLTVVRSSPCFTDPAGDACQQAKRESDRAQSLRDSCISPHTFLTDEAFRTQTRCPQAREGGSNAPDPNAPSGGRTAPVDGGDGGAGDGGADSPGTSPPPDSADPDPSPPPAPEPPDGPGPPGGEEDTPTLGDAVDQVTGLLCQITDPLTGLCLR